jgi:hypothetical protein
VAQEAERSASPYGARATATDNNALRASALEVEVKLLREMLDAMREDRNAWREQASNVVAALPLPITTVPDQRRSRHCLLGKERKNYDFRKMRWVGAATRPGVIDSVLKGTQRSFSLSPHAEPPVGVTPAARATLLVTTLWGDALVVILLTTVAKNRYRTDCSDPTFCGRH